MVTTSYTIFRPGQPDERGSVDWPKEPGLKLLHGMLDPIIGNDLEHVAVLHEGRRADMFVGGSSAIDGSPANAAATRVYRNNALTQSPSMRPDSLPEVYGAAVLFDRLVWF